MKTDRLRKDGLLIISEPNRDSLFLQVRNLENVIYRLDEIANVSGFAEGSFLANIAGRLKNTSEMLEEFTKKAL